MIIKEFLVRLGVQDSFTAGLEKMLNNGSNKVAGFAGSWGKQWLLAGGAVVTGLTMANVGVAKFLTGLIKVDDELTAFARQTWRSRDEAYKTKSALDAMGKSLEEIRMNPRLLKEYRELRANAEKLKPPDMSEGLSQVRGLITEYNKLKQLGGAAIQWVGFYLLKYIQKPMQQLKEQLGGINGKLTATLPEWTEKVGRALSWIVRLGSTLVRSLGLVLGAVKQLFDIIPDKVKIAMGALAALGLFIRAGPIGRLIMILSTALLLLEDFFTYLDGGESKFGKLWKTLTDIWSLLKQSGVIDTIKAKASEALEYISGKIQSAKDYLAELYQKFLDSGAVEQFKKLLKESGRLLAALIQPITELGGQLLSAFGGAGKRALEWFISDGLPNLLRVFTDIAGGAAKIFETLNQLGLTKPLILGLVGAFTGFKAIGGITSSMAKLTGIIEGLSKVQNMVNPIKGLVGAFGGLKKAVTGVKSAQMVLNAVFAANPIGIVIAAVMALIAVAALVIQNWDKVSSFFSGFWNTIQSIFGNIGNWFSERFNQARDAVVGAFTNLPEKLLDTGSKMIESIWKGVLSKANWLKDKVAGFFSSIWDNVKGAFSGGGSSESAGGLPGHADGGVFSKEHIARFAEGGRPEAVVPLTKPNRAREVLEQAARFLGGNTSGGAAEQALSGMKAFMEKAQAILIRMDGTMKSGSTPISNANTVNNNQKYDNRSTFNIYDNSGNPRSTATAVDRQQQMRARNSQGVYA